MGREFKTGTEQTVELFCGSKPFSQLAEALGYGVFTVDINPARSPDLTADIRAVAAGSLPSSPFIVWAAPPDAPAFHDPESWDKDGSFHPANSAAEKAVELFRSTISTITAMKPTWWFIEHPKSLLRKMPLTAGFNRGYPSRSRQTIRHDQYGGNGDGETDVWTNAFWWIPRPAESDSSEDVPVQRRVPPYVYAEIFEQLENYQLAKVKG
jgi:hypothetical protein